ncbi:MAG: flp pilus-assembly TadE/G-like family protein [Actinomycetaceae bacterium]|nr:flp pilus-assembly TadE/G-like family protein [Actinomycetaceae bacterium]
MSEEDGVGTVSAMMTLAVSILLAGILFAGIAIQVEYTRGQAALDFASLGAARAIVADFSQTQSTDPCTVARLLIHENGATMKHCRVSNLDVYVTGEKTLSFFNYTLTLTIRSHGGYIKEILNY